MMEYMSRVYFEKVVDILSTQTSKLSKTIDQVYTKHRKSVTGTTCNEYIRKHIA